MHYYTPSHENVSDSGVYLHALSAALGGVNGQLHALENLSQVKKPLEPIGKVAG